MTKYLIHRAPEPLLRPPEAGWKRVCAAGLLVAAVAAAYAGSFRGPFLFDDLNSIVDNPSIRQLWSLQVLTAPPSARTTVGRPVVNISLAVNYAIGGLNVWGYHAVNILLHSLAALTLYGLVRRTLLLPSLADRFGRAATGLAFAVALLWAIHPLQTESVTYMIQRAESIVGLFYLLTFYCLVRGATAARGGAWYAAAVAACGLGMASKEVMVSAPLVALLYDRTFLCGSFKAALRRRWGLYLALAGTWAILGVTVWLSLGRGGSAGFNMGMSMWSYLRTQFGCIVHYVRLVFWPHPLVLDYGVVTADKPMDIVPYAIAIGLLITATITGIRRRPKWGFLGAWFFAILAPSSSFIPLVGQVEAEHRMYLPLAGVVGLVVLGAFAAMDALRRRAAQSEAADKAAWSPAGVVAPGEAEGKAASPAGRAAAWALLLAVAAALGWCTHERNRDYRSALAIWKAAAEDCPGNVRALSTYGGELVETDPDDAIAYTSRAIEMKPRYAKPYVNRGMALEKKGQLDAAIRDYDKAIALAPEDPIAYNNRGNAYTGKGLCDEAIGDFDKALSLNPDYAEAYSNRAVARNRMGLHDAAAEDCDKAISLKPDYALAYNNRGLARKGKQQYGEAVRDFDTAIRLDPACAPAYNNRAVAHYYMKAYDKAWADVRACRKLGNPPSPSFVEALTRDSGRSK